MPGLYAMLQQPVLKLKPWGGRKLQTLFGKPLEPGQKVGESWELADHPHGESHVARGPLLGRSLRWVVENCPDELYGPGAAAAWRRRFPLLVKLIDASEDLSVQVHPGDEFARGNGSDICGKTECWVILQAAPGAQLITGVESGVSKEDFRRAAERGQLEPLLVRQEVRAGDVVFVAAGRLHAIGAGIVLAEFQQSSDTTYRVHDWGRQDADGRSRELHLEQALECTRFEGRFPAAGGRGFVLNEGGATVESLVECRELWLERVTLVRSQAGFRLDRSWDPAAPAGVSGFQCVMIIEGQGTLEVPMLGERLPVTTGQTVLVPAVVGSFVLRAPQTLVALTSGVNRSLDSKGSD
jgi:mannose-6-phosphate isomerase